MKIWIAPLLLLALAWPAAAQPARGSGTTMVVHEDPGEAVEQLDARQRADAQVIYLQPVRLPNQGGDRFPTYTTRILGPGELQGYQNPYIMGEGSNHWPFPMSYSNWGQWYSLPNGQW